MNVLNKVCLLLVVTDSGASYSCLHSTSDSACQVDSSDVSALLQGHVSAYKTNSLSNLEKGHATSEIMLEKYAASKTNAVSTVGKDSTSIVMKLVSEVAGHQLKSNSLWYPDGWHVYANAFTLWSLLLTFLLGWEYLASAIAKITKRIWKNLYYASPPAMNLSTPEDKENLSKSDVEVQPCIDHAPLAPGITFLELLFQDGLTCSHRLAIVGANDERRSWTFVELRDLMRSPAWSSLAAHKCVSPALPNGPECAAVLLCLIARTKCAPLDAAMPKEEAVAAMQRVGTEVVLISKGAAEGVQSAARQLKLDIWSVPAPSEAVEFVPKPSFGSQALAPSDIERWNTTEDVALLLRTSGTTGKSKVVPLSSGQLVTGACSIATSMQLRQDDVCLNAMPLFHIGGISCNLLGSIVSSGCVICLDQFTPSSFVQRLGSSMPRPTWYYSSPAIHLALVNFCSGCPPSHSLRLVRSGAAVLSPDLQERLRDLWGCQVLATYSMTECMPIASPVVNECKDSDSGLYHGWLASIGSVGRVIGPNITIRGGEVMLSGSLVMRGYEGSDSGWTSDGLLPTGDQGFIDSNGFLRLTGRKKETINRGGETIPPQEVEESLMKCPQIQEVAAFAMPQELLGETVGLAVVQKLGTGAADLLVCVNAIKEKLQRSHSPGLIAFVDSLPRTPSGKVQRLSLHTILKNGGGPKTAMTDPTSTIVIDARGTKCKAVCHVLPNSDTVAAIVSSEEGDEGEVEFVDSLGMSRRSTRKGMLEMTLASQMYLVGWLGVTFNHWGWYLKNANSQMMPALRLLMMSIGGNGSFWHLGLFFAAAGYLDRRDRDFGIKDAFLIVAALGLHPLMWVGFCSLNVGRSGSWIASSDVSLNVGIKEHPAGWFFQCLLAARAFSIILKKMGTSSMMQLFLGLLYSVLWPNISHPIIWKLTQHCPAVLRKIVWWLGFPIDVDMWKLASSAFTYLAFASVIPQVVECLARRGPRTRAGERRLGAFLWLLFVSWNLLDIWNFDLVDVIPNTTKIWIFAIPDITNLFSLPVVWMHIGVLAAALAYLPFTAIPDVMLRGLLPAILMMKLLFAPSLGAALWAMFHAIPIASIQMVLLFTFFGGFLTFASFVQLSFDQSIRWLLKHLRECW